MILKKPRKYCWKSWLSRNSKKKKRTQKLEKKNMGARFGRASIPAMRAAPASPPRQAAKPRSVSASASRPRTSLPLDAALLAKASRIEQQLRELFPNPVVPLDHRNGFELLCAVVLSAQSTDKKVNEITPALFEAAREDVAATPHKMAGLGQARIKDLIKQIGLSNNKASGSLSLSLSLSATLLTFPFLLPATTDDLRRSSCPSSRRS